MRMMQLLALVALGLSLTACLTKPTRSTATTISDSIQVACSAFEPITYRPLENRLGQIETEDNVFDSDITVKQIRGHNASWVELCGVK